MNHLNFFSQEDDRLTSLIQEKSTFNKLHERKHFEIVKKYEHPTDFFVDIKDGKLDAILNCENSYKDLIQICVEIKSERISDKNEVQSDTFHVLTKRIERNRSDVRDEIVKNLMKNLTNHQQQGSGWVITGIGNMHVDYFVKTRTIKTYGKYVN